MKTDNLEMAGIMSSPSNEGGCPVDDPGESISGGANRRSYKPAAMFGLALSVGTCGGLMLPHRSAMAVEVRASDSVSSQQPVSSDTETPTEAPKVAVVSPDVVPQQDVVVPSVAEMPSPVMTDASGQHTVQEGETLWLVAESYGVDVKALAMANHLQPNAVLRVGQALALPQHHADARRQPQVQTAPMMVSLAGRSRAQVDNQQAMASQGSDLKSDQETAMQVLREKRGTLKQSLAELGEESTPVSTKLKVGASTSEFTLYLVSPGDTLAKIAADHNVSYQKLVAFNGIDNPNQLAPSQVIKLPQVTRATEPQVMTGQDLSQPQSSAGTSTTLLAEPIAGTGNPASSETATAAEVQQQKLSDSAVAIHGANESSLAAEAADLSASNLPGQQKSEAASAQVALNAPISPGIGDTANSPSQVIESVQRQERAGSVSLPQSVVPSQTHPRFAKTSLILEIQNLRQQYQHQATVPTSRPVAQISLPVAPVKLAKTNNPDFASRSSSETSSLSLELENLSKQKQKPEEKTTADIPKIGSPFSGRRQVVARAVLGSEAYAPVVSPVQKMVAPNLPPLGREDSYLPGRNQSTTGFIWPSKGVLSSGYGWRWGRMHRGIDIAGPVGTPIVAAAPGVISYAGWNDGGYGYMVEIEHTDGSMTRYAHNSRLLVRTGQPVNQGEQISEMGSTGYSTGPHLHFEIHPKGQGAVNPIAFLDRNA